jgi:uncharacterized protein
VSSPLHPHSPFRIFAISALTSIIGLVAIGAFMGISSLTVAIILVAIEIAFSFDNAIINAKVLAKLSVFWQRMFLTIGAFIAIFGMRVVFPIAIVALTADLSWRTVVDLALHHPEQYAEHLGAAHTTIAAFGGAFLMLLAFDFFVDQDSQVMWFTRLERNLRKLASHWAPPVIAAVAVLITAYLPFNHHRHDTLVAGFMGILVYSLLHGLTEMLGRVQKRRTGNLTTYTGALALMSFLYLEVLDASFSFDGVIGAFTITNKIVLIAVGLGIGALWVRSITIFMVRRGTLGNYKYVEHGAHYTIFVLGCLLLVSIMYDVPDVIAGLAGLGIIASSIIASRQAMEAKHLRSN